MTAMIQSVTLYGSEIWWKDQANCRRYLQRIINQETKLITGAFRSTSEAALMIEAGIRTIEA